MATRLNRYYNNPAIGQAFENIASMFAPPSAQEIAGYAQANKLRTENEGLEALMHLAGDPNADLNAFDRYGAATGMFNPNQGFGARDMADATQRYGYDTASADRRYDTDVTAGTTLATNRLDNQTRAIGDLFGPLSQGQVRPEVPDEFMSAIGLPGAAAVEGAPKPLSETEVEGALLQDAIGTGMIGPKDAADLYRSGINIEQVIGADIDGDGVNDPLNVARGDAIGRQPYNNPGSAPAKGFKSWTSPTTGRSGIAVTDPATGSVTDNASGQPLPPDAILADVNAPGVEGLTTATAGAAQRQVMAIDSALATAGELQRLINASPASGGLVGSIRGGLQDLIATGGELGQLAQSLQVQTQSDIAAGILDADAAAAAQMAFDPSIPARQALTVLLATQIAKAQSPDRVSNELLRSITRSLGEGSILANQQRTSASLDALIGDLRMRRDVLGPYGTKGSEMPISPDVRPQSDPAQGIARPRAVNPQTGETIEFDGDAWVPVQ